MRIALRRHSMWDLRWFGITGKTFHVYLVSIVPEGNQARGRFYANTLKMFHPNKVVNASTST